MSDVVTINLGLILLIASVVAMISRRMRLPYSVGLVAAGILLARTPGVSHIFLSPEGIFTVLLPPLIFEAALQIQWRPFRKDLLVIFALAFAGVAIAAALVAAGMHFLVGWSWIGAALFGVLIAATDPVSVIAAFKEMKVEARLSLLVEAESLLNDGAAAVGFAMFLGVAGGSDLDPTSIGALLLWKVLGGFIVGGGLAGGLLLLAGRTDDHRSLRCLPHRGALRNIRRAGIACRWDGRRQYRLARLYFPKRAQPRPRLLAICGLPCELDSLHPDWSACGSSGASCVDANDPDCHCAGVARAGGRGLSTVGDLQPLQLGCGHPLSAYPGVGRLAGRTRPCFGSGAPREFA